MMARPNHIDLGSRAFLDPNRTGTPSPNELPSPRSGDIPPALSPLDAFALQSRLLAKKLEDSQLEGNRLSRLPPHTIATELAKSRNGYFNPLSTTSPSADDLKAEDKSPDKGTIAQSPFRPMSMYPSIIQGPTDDRPESAWAIRQNTQEEPSLQDQWAGLQNGVRPLVNRDYFTQGRSGSPEPYTKREPAQTVNNSTMPWMISKGRPPPLEPRKQPTNESLRSNDSNMLYPPRSPAFSKSSGGPASIRSVQMDSGDDSDQSWLNEPQDRNLQSGYSPFRSRSPFSPVFAPPRSPSMSSDHSFNAARIPRQSLNFSRPISRTGRPIVQRPSLESVSRPKEESDQPRPSLDVLSLQESVGSPGIAPALYFDSPETRASEEESALPPLQTEADPQPAASYIYTKYSLPRGRMVSRDSMIIPDHSTYVFEWEQPVSGTNITPTTGLPTGSSAPVLPTVSAESLSQPIPQNPFLAPTSNPVSQHTRSRSADGTSSTTSTIKAPTILVPPSTSASFSFPIERPRSSTPTASGRIRPLIPMTKTAFFAPINKLRADTLTPEEHLAEGISCHQEGALQKSTYHLRIAANAGLPTGMLLYALACRHGWGMRPNASEGVKWLQKAVDSAGLEVAYDEESVAAAQARQQRKSSGTTGGAPAIADFAARKTHKAQFALSIYELGVSYMNGWGISQDRALALRCFEIAGAWGDGDALAEAGFCYAKGVGCKKDLKRAAGLYRRAEAKGVEMAGNSWIYKDKYLTPPGTSSSSFFSNPFSTNAPAAAASAGVAATPASDVASGTRKSRKSREKSRDRDREKEERDREKKGRDKSRTRGLFGGRKRSTTAGAAEAAGTEVSRG